MYALYMELKDKEVELKDKDIKLSNKDVKLSNKDVELSNKDVELKDKDVKLSNKDVELKDKDIKIIEITAQNLIYSMKSKVIMEKLFRDSYSFTARGLLGNSSSHYCNNY